MTKQTKSITIDASNKVLGRLATEIATKLRGKDNPNFEYYKFYNQEIVITNASKIKLTGKKESQKVYYSHSGYIGKLKTKNYKDTFDKNPKLIIINAVKGMLPKNRLQKKWLKNLTVLNGDTNEQN